MDKRPHRPSNEGKWTMQTARTLVGLRTTVSGWHKAGQSVALVPTMGALHAGHLRLVEEARRQADKVVASIFVNPTQFGPNEDFSRYPRQEDADAALLAEAHCDLLWLPDVATMYPDGFATTVSVADVADGLCGAARPGHFDGVATVVLKLLNQVSPDTALFGEKDYQQLCVIRRMAQDLNLPVNIMGVATVREADGLALSSRNAYLSAQERAAAVALPKALAEAKALMEAGGPVDRALAQARDALAAAGFGPVDYVEVRDAQTLAPMMVLDRPARLLAAARIGNTRLIDNVAVQPGA